MCPNASGECKLESLDTMTTGCSFISDSTTTSLTFSCSDLFIKVTKHTNVIIASYKAYKKHTSDNTTEKYKNT